MSLVKIRKATKNDVPELVKQRRLMFESMGFDDLHKLQFTSTLSNRYFLEHIMSGKYYGWVAITETGRIVSNAGVIMDHHPPGPNNLTGEIAYIFNLYTLPEFRRQGIARRIMERIIEWTEEKKISIVALHATDDGEKLYYSLGFIPSREMVLKIKNEE